MLLRLIEHFVLLFLPAFALCLFAARRNVRDILHLGNLALAATAASGYCCFLLWFVSWRLVRPVGLAAEVGALLYIALTWKSSAAGRTLLKPLLIPIALVLTSSLSILSATYAYGGLETPLMTTVSRFSHPLPGDNFLPYSLAYSMMRDKRVPIPLQVDWHASDRPPLQTAVFMGEFFGLVSPKEISYEVLSVLLQSLWVFGLWLLLYGMGVDSWAISLTLAGTLFSSFVLVNSMYVWPKLMAASYLLGFLSLLLSGRLDRKFQPGSYTAILAGVLLAFSVLSHGGTVFACLGIVLALPFMPRNNISVKVGLLTLMTALALYLPWIGFQKFYDPPGDRLIKTHVGGSEAKDNRSAMQTIVDTYRATPRQQLVANKSANFEMIFERFQFWTTLRQLFFELPEKEPARSQGRVRDAKRLNEDQFFYFPSTLGFYILGLPLLLLGLFPRWRSREWALAILFTLLAVLTDVAWALIMFGPSTTSIHAGAYMTVLLSFAACILGLWMLSRWVAAAVVSLQILLFAYIHVLLIVPFQMPLEYVNVFLLIVGVVATFYLLIKLGRFVSLTD